MSRTALAIFLFIMVLCGGALAGLGRQVLEQDRSLERQRTQERLEHAADNIVASLERGFSLLESKSPPEGAVVFTATESAIVVSPPGVLVYYPEAAAEPDEPPASIYAVGERLEYQHSDSLKAAEVFRALERSADPAVRGGALLRLGRNLRKLRQNQEALAAYGRMGQLGAVRVMGVPAELMAREARSRLLEAMGDRHELQEEAALMYAALQSGRWHLTRPVWEFHLEEARRWSEAGPLTASEQDALALSHAAESICSLWRARHDVAGRRILRVEGNPVLISTAAEAGALTAVLAGPALAGSLWKDALEGQEVRAALLDGDGQVLMGSTGKDASQAVRHAVGTRLAATLHVTSANSGAELAGLAARRRLLLAGFAVLTMVLLAGSYFILRSIARERAVGAMQSEFVSAVSHEFRTPLTSLRQVSDMLARGRIPTDELRQESYEIISRESERLQRLVESVLDFGRMEARSFRYRLEDMDPAAMVRDVVADFQAKAVAQGYRVELAGAHELPPIRADREALGLALWNLFDNAVKYSPDCRTVWVEIARDDTRVAIRVRDRGMGIPAVEQKQIFKKFVRGARSRAANIQGSGIGLAMVRYIVEAHAGEIRLESAPGKGSTFTILLPLEGLA